MLRTALGPAIALVNDPAELTGLAIGLQIERSGQPVFSGSTSTAQMKRAFSELAAYLFRELDLPGGAFLMTGTGIVPPESFSLAPGDRVRVQVGDLLLETPVGA